MLEGEELEKETNGSLEVAQKKEKQVNTSQGTRVKIRLYSSEWWVVSDVTKWPPMRDLKNQSCVFSLAILGKASREPRIEVSPQEVKTWMGGC